jgi:hypothetical protein
METIAQHFEDPDPISENGILGLITDGELAILAVQGFTGLDWQNLKESCEAAVKERGAHPFLGRKTLGDLCGRAMELLARKHRIRAPKCWVPLMRRLRQGGPSVLRPPAAEKSLNEMDPADFFK